MTNFATFPYAICQMGNEVASPTPVAATTIWRGPFPNPDDTRDRRTVEEHVGALYPEMRVYDTRLGVQIDMPETELTYEQVVHVLSSAIEDVTPTGAGPYAWVYATPTGSTAHPDVKFKTFELGNLIATADFRQVPMCWVSEFELSGSQGEPWTVSATWMGQKFNYGHTPTPALALPDVTTPALFSNTVLTIDDSLGTIGSTQVDEVLMDFTLQYSTGIQWVPVATGLAYTAVKFVKPEITFTITLELEEDDANNSRVATERAAYDTRAFRLFRLACSGDGSNDMTMDFAGRYTDDGSYEETDGNTTVTFEGRVEYSSADSLLFELTIDNDLSALP